MSAPRPGSTILAGREGCHFSVCPGPMPELLRGGKTYRSFWQLYCQATGEKSNAKVCYIVCIIIIQTNPELEKSRACVGVWYQLLAMIRFVLLPPFLVIVPKRARHPLVSWVSCLISWWVDKHSDIISALVCSYILLFHGQKTFPTFKLSDFEYLFPKVRRVV